MSACAGLNAASDAAEVEDAVDRYETADRFGSDAVAKQDARVHREERRQVSACRMPDQERAPRIAPPGRTRVAHEADGRRYVVERVVAAADERVLPVPDDGGHDAVTRKRDADVAEGARQRFQPTTVEGAPVSAVDEDDDRRGRGAGNGLWQIEIELSLRVGGGGGVRDIEPPDDEVAPEVVVATSGPEPKQTERRSEGGQGEEAFSARRSHPVLTPPEGAGSRRVNL